MRVQINPMGMRPGVDAEIAGMAGVQSPIPMVRQELANPDVKKQNFHGFEV